MTTPYGGRGGDRFGNDEGEDEWNAQNPRARSARPSDQSRRRPRPSSGSSRRRDERRPPGQGLPAERQNDYQENVETHSDKAVDPQRRGIALMADVIIAFIFSLMLAALISLISKIIPPLASLITQQAIVVAFLLCRDGLYQGHGIGKNMMGLQVVDVATGAAPTMLQSIKRNIIFFVPFIVKEVVTAILQIVHLPTVNTVVLDLVNLLCMIYTLIILPLECWTAYSQPDSRRLGDKFAGTKTIESSMDFSKPL